MRAITVPGAALTAVVDPARGAKITSLRDSSGVEWLAQAASPRDFPVGTAFTDAEMAGWDECAPTISACVVDARELPDHGDLWDAVFDVENDGSTVVATGISLRYLFRRTMGITPTGLLLEYEVEALDRAMPFLWAAHPQFSAPPGTRVEFDGVTRVVDVLDPARPEVDWTGELATIDTVEPGGYRKVYPTPERSVQAARLVRPEGTLAITWSEECPYVGVWFDGAAYSREPVIAVEPTTGYFDALDTAVRLGRVPTLAPGAPLRWWVRLDVSAAA